MKQFKLTDVEGKEFILSVNEEKVGNILTGKDVFISPAVTPEPEIKVGTWRWTFHKKWDNQEKHKARLIRVARYEKGLIYSDEGLPYKPENTIPATPAEIEAHLKKVCEKYVGSVRLNSTTINPDYSPNVLFEIGHDGFYDAVNDRYIMSGVVVYQRGKFAEILPDKKKRPETREEFMQFCGDFCNRKTPTVQDFLNQYDI